MAWKCLKKVFCYQFTKLESTGIITLPINRVFIMSGSGTNTSPFIKLLTYISLAKHPHFCKEFFLLSIKSKSHEFDGLRTSVKIKNY